MLKMLMRRGSVRLACLGLLALSAVAYVYYFTSSPPPTSSALNPLLHKHIPIKAEERRGLPGREDGGEGGGGEGGGGGDGDPVPEVKGDPVKGDLALGDLGQGQGVPSHQCHSIQAPRTDITTVEQFPKFDFQPSWMRGKEFWDTNFEKRYLKRRSKWKKLPLKVVLMPHSHNDPGWLKTFEEYYFHQTSKILQNMIDKLRVHSNMTFIWTEVSFLSLWYERAHPSLRQQLKELVDGGRLEVATGGWIMTDEANVHLYAMLDQLVEGHQWLFNTLGVRAANGWSVDPFGHGAAVPYLLGASDVNNIVIQRIHYAWKQWLAEQQLGDFLWRQVWDSTGATDVLCHNRPYDIYSIKHSCGPHPQICLGFDFRKIPGEYTEYTIKSVPIDERNIRQKAELLLEQYGRTGSLYPHNVVLVPIGDDFRYDHAEEWDQQYINYQKIINFINSDPKYHANVQWGTLKDYFGEVRKRMRDYTSLQGDFFVYSDIFSEGRPAYWSGYFATRPYWKILDRQLEASLRSAEILYTWAYTKAVQDAHSKVIQILEKDYEKLVRARRNLGLFQHHDAITGTSKAYVMHDYAIKLHEGLRDSVALQAHAMEFLLLTPGAIGSISAPGPLVAEPMSRLQPDFERATYERLPRKLPLDAPRSQPRLIVLFNSLAQRRHEVVKVLVRTPDIRLTDEHDHEVPFQLNPVWSDTGNGLAIVSSQFEMLFIADLPPLSVVTYALHRSTTPTTEQRASVYSNYFARSNDPSHSPPFETNEVQPGDIQLESDHLKLLFDGTTGMLRSITNKDSDHVTQTTVRYAAYPSAQFKSGAYLFKPDPNAREPEEDVLSGTKPHIFIHSGPIASELTVMFGSVLMHTTRIFHVDAEPLATAVYLENTYNLGTRYNSTETPGFPPHFRETELFLRVMTDIDNGAEPEFYTDQSGLNMQKRIRVKRIGIQGNYFPVTSATFLQDNNPTSRGQRLTLLVDHATGAASWRQGWLEVMVERRTFYDDARGMGEGVTDQKKTVGRYWLLLEDMVHEDEEVPRLSLAAHHLSNTLNYPATLLVNEGLTAEHLNTAAHLISRPLPCPLHVLTLRTLPEQQYPSLLPSHRALLVVQHQAASCTITSRVRTCTGLGGSPYPGTHLTVWPTTMELTSLTGLRVQGPLPSLAELDVPQHRLQAVLLTFPMHQHHHRHNPNNESNKQPQGKL